ncbi:MAG: hypothetical protein ABW176_17775 [Candidatus Thiodiazotropha endolucinida]
MQKEVNNMFKKWMKALISILILAVLSSPVFAFSDSELNKLLAQIDSAVEARDTSKIAHLFSDRASIIIEMPTPQGNSKIELNKQQYLQMTQQAWDMVGPSYKYSRLQTETVSNETKAQVVSLVREEFQVNGQTITSETLEVVDLAVEGGRLVIVKVVGEMHIKGEPIPKPSI